MKKFITIILTLVSLATIFVACGKPDNSDNSSGTDNSDEVKEILLYDFEDYDKSFQLMRVCGYFGAVNVNKDAKYVKSGKRSALLQPLGPESLGNAQGVTEGNPETCLYIPLSSQKYGFDYTDGNKLAEVRFSIYNAENKNLNLYVSLIMEKKAQRLSPCETFALKPGWNEVFYTPDHSVIAINDDLSQCYGIALNFDNVHSRYLKDAPKLYLDDLSITLVDKPFQTENLVVLKDREVCDFESDWQKYVLMSKVDDRSNAPDMEIIKASDYGLVAPSGSRVLRVTMKPTNLIVGTVYNGFGFTQALIDAVGFGKYGDDDYFAFDVYNASDMPMDFPTVFWNTKENGYKGLNILVNPGDWATARISLGMLDELFGKGERTYRDNPSNIVIQWAEFTGEERVAFFDNFRIEKGATK